MSFDSVRSPIGATGFPNLNETLLVLYHHPALPAARTWQNMTPTIPTRLSFLFSRALVACTTSPPSTIPTDSAMESAVKAPLVDLNLLRKKIPNVLENARIAPYAMPAQLLFEGGLPAPVLTSAQTLGLTHFPIVTTRIACANASNDLDQVDAQTLLIGLDNRVWTLSQTAGTDSATSADGKAAGRVQLLLERHFSSEMGFLPQAADASAPFSALHGTRR